MIIDDLFEQNSGKKIHNQTEDRVDTEKETVRLPPAMTGRDPTKPYVDIPGTPYTVSMRGDDATTQQDARHLGTFLASVPNPIAKAGGMMMRYLGQPDFLPTGEKVARAMDSAGNPDEIGRYLKKKAVREQGRRSKTAKTSYQGSYGAQQIGSANQITNLNQIRAGQKLKIPGSEQLYTVKKGDTLDKIAQRYDIYYEPSAAQKMSDRIRQEFGIGKDGKSTANNPNADLNPITKKFYQPGSQEAGQKSNDSYFDQFKDAFELRKRREERYGKKPPKDLSTVPDLLLPGDTKKDYERYFYPDYRFKTQKELDREKQEQELERRQELQRQKISPPTELDPDKHQDWEYNVGSADTLPKQGMAEDEDTLRHQGSERGRFPHYYEIRDGGAAFELNLKNGKKYTVEPGHPEWDTLYKQHFDLPTPNDYEPGRGWYIGKNPLAEAGPFSFGAKKSKKGSVADLAAKKRREQERDKQPAEPRDQRVGVAKVVKEYGDTAKGQKMLTKVQKRAVDRLIKADDKNRLEPDYTKRDLKTVRKHQATADRAWDRMSDLNLDEASVYKKDQDLSSVSTQELEAFVRKHWFGGVPTYGQGESVKRAMRELRRRQKQGVAEGKQPGQPVVDAILQVMPGAQEIWFHGSRVTGKHRRNSDTDILVVVPDNLVGDKYLGAVRILQKLNSQFDNYDIQPTKSGTNIHRIAQEEGQLLWSHKQGVAEAEGQQLSVNQLAMISDEALDNAYGYGRSSPGNTFGWQANLMSAAYAKKMIDAGVTDIEKIADAIHKGWNVTAQKFVQDPDQFDDTEKLRQAGKLDAKLAQRAKLMRIGYFELDNDEQEKDRVVARALLKAIKGEQGVAETVLNPRDPQGDYDAKRKVLHDLSLDPGVDQQAVQQRRLDLDREAKAKGLKEFAPSGGGDGRWYSDDQLYDIIGEDWLEAFDVSGDQGNIDLNGERARLFLAQEAEAWLTDRGYRVNVLDVRDDGDELSWYIQGPLYRGLEEGSLDPSGLIAAAQMARDFIITAEVGGKTKKFRIRGMTGPGAAKERFIKHHGMAKVLDVKPEQGVAEGGFDIPEIPRAQDPKPPRPVKENMAAGISKFYNNAYDPVTANLQRVALLAMQGRQDEAMGQLQAVIKTADPDTQQKIISAVNNIKPVMIQGRVATSSELDNSKPHRDYILQTFLPWVQNMLSHSQRLQESSVRDKLDRQFQQLRSKRGAPDPKYYKELGASYDIKDDQERYQHQAKLKQKYGVKERRMTCPECGGAAYEDMMLAEKQDACYHKVKSRYKVWPSAYASGALVRCRKKGAANWGNKSKK